jgi:quercetin dioxygenase-like cupin family protein
VFPRASADGRLEPMTSAITTPTTITRRPSVLADASEREQRSFLGDAVTVLATGGDTAERYAILELVLAPGTATPLHRHRADEESFVVLYGEIVVQAGDQPPVLVGAGGFVHVPAGMSHALRVPEGDSARILTITTPGHERFVRAAGLSGPGPDLLTPQDEARLMAAAERYGTEILGPPPAFD